VCRLRARSWPTEAHEIAHQARDWARQTLTTWDVQDPDGVVALILTELVTNSVRYAGAPVDVTLAVSQALVDLTVTDHALDRKRQPRRRRVGRVWRLTAPGPTATSRPSGAVPLTACRRSPLSVVFSHAPQPVADALGEQPLEGVPEDGRGLFLVDAFAECWAITPTSQGSRAWARCDVDADWPYRQACACRPDNPSAVPLASGHVVVPMPLV